MKKILIAADPGHLNQYISTFGCRLARLTKSMFAIKRLADLLPEPPELRVTVLEVVEPGREPIINR